MAIYPHGNPIKYAQGCRCGLCGLVNARYTPPEPAPRNRTIPAAPVRDHIRALRDSGWLVREIADRSGYHEGTIRSIDSGRTMWTQSFIAEDLLSLRVKVAA